MGFPQKPESFQQPGVVLGHIEPADVEDGHGFPRLIGGFGNAPGQVDAVVNHGNSFRRQAVEIRNGSLHLRGQGHGHRPSLAEIGAVDDFLNPALRFPVGQAVHRMDAFLHPGQPCRSRGIFNHVQMSVHHIRAFLPHDAYQLGHH